MSPRSSPHELTRRVEFLDAMRGFAVLTVFAFHSFRASVHHQDLFEWNDWFADFGAVPAYKLALIPFNLGWCGVAIFFVISGFCIHISHSRGQDPWFQRFFTRRLLRIFPPYLLALLVFSFVYPFGAIDMQEPRDLANFFAHLLLAHNFYDLEIFAGINPSFWSIAVESQLYLLYPLMFLLARRRGWKTTLMLCAAIELPIRFFVAATISEGGALDRAITASPLAYVLSWGIGAAIADAYLRRDKLPFANQSFWFWLSVSVIAPHILPLSPFSFLIHAVTTGVFISRSLQGEQILPRLPGSRLVSRHLAFVGMVSYSFYLIHQPLLNRVEPVVRRLLNFQGELHPLATLALCLTSWPIVVGLAWCMYHAVERPSIALARSVLRRPAKPAAAGHTAAKLMTSRVGE